MLVMLAGGLGLCHEPCGGIVADLASTLGRLGHDPRLFAPAEKPSLSKVGLFVAFVDESSVPLANCIQDAADAGVPVLCVARHRLPTSDYLVAAHQAGELQAICYSDFDDLCGKVLQYARLVMPTAPAHASVH